jgi:hypothetical protein
MHDGRARQRSSSAAERATSCIPAPVHDDECTPAQSRACQHTHTVAKPIPSGLPAAKWQGKRATASG